MERAILRVLAAEVQRRHCPGCEGSLARADVSAHFSGRDQARLQFRCHACGFEGGGEIELTQSIYHEAARTARAEDRLLAALEPISADDILAVHERLGAWNGAVTQLLGRAEPTSQPG